MLTYFDNVRYADTENLEVFVDTDTNDLYVTQPTIERLLGYEPDNARKKLRSKALKTALGGDSTVGKTVTCIDTLGRKNKAKAIPLRVLNVLLLLEFRKGNERAEALMFAGFNDSFKSLVLEQCGVKIGVDARFKEMAEYLTEYRGLHDWLRDEYIKVYRVRPESQVYRLMNVRLNQALFSRNHFNCDRLSNASTKELDTLKMAQKFLHGMLKQGKHNEITNPLERVIYLIDNHQDVLTSFR